jgi:hypothetical protein
VTDKSNIDWKEFIFSIEMVEKFVDKPIDLAMDKFNEFVKDEVKDKVLWIQNFKIKTKTGEIKLEKNVSKNDVITHVIITYIILDTNKYISIRKNLFDLNNTSTLEDSLIDNWDKFTFKIDFDYNSINSVINLAFSELDKHIKPKANENIDGDEVTVFKNIKIITQDGDEIDPDKTPINPQTKITNIIITYKITSLISIIRKDYERNNKPSNGDKKRISHSHLFKF